MEQPLRIGTRGSRLAVAQTGWVVRHLEEQGVEVVVETITTRGDADRFGSLAAMGGDGVFVRELERALLAERIDVAVHSLKDLPTAEVAGLEIAVVPERASPFDALVSHHGDSLAGLPPAAVVGTSSVRRLVQVKAHRPDLDVRPIRGNVETRLAKLDADEYHCLVLAAAGLERLGLGQRITSLLEPPEFWPAVGQGALALQIRSGDEAVRRAIMPLDHRPTHAAVLAERACLAQLSAGCLAPVGGWGRVEGEELVLGARVLEQEGQAVRYVTAEQRLGGPLPGSGGRGGITVEGGEKLLALGRRVAADLLAAGAGPMLERMRRPVAPG
jgi:hydroxymethylbilane synthase